jgi:hypothetical protein
MRGKLGYIAASAALLVVVSGLAIAQAATVITAPETIVFTAHPGKYAQVNMGSKGDDPGDSFMFVDNLFDEADLTKLGAEHVQCVTQPGKGWNLCTVGLFIDGRGEILIEGAIQFAEGVHTFDLPITGGTGDFAGVGGYATHADSTGDTSIITLNLLP